MLMHPVDLAENALDTIAVRLVSNTAPYGKTDLNGFVYSDINRRCHAIANRQ